MNGINLILKAKLPLKIKTDVMTYNREELPKIKKFIQGLGLKFRPNVLLHSRLNGDSAAGDLRITPRDALSSKLGNNSQNSGCGLSELSADRLAARSLFGCTASKGDGLYIDPYGNLFPCLCIREPKVDLFKEHLDYAYERIVTWMRTVDSAIEPVCAGCTLRGICRNCPGKALLEVGKLEGRIGWFCKLAQLEGAKRLNSRLGA